MTNKYICLWSARVNNWGWDTPQTYYFTSRKDAEEFSACYPAADAVRYAGRYAKENAMILVAKSDNMPRRKCVELWKVTVSDQHITSSYYFNSRYVAEKFAAAYMNAEVELAGMFTKAEAQQLTRKA